MENPEGVHVATAIAISGGFILLSNLLQLLLVPRRRRRPPATPPAAGTAAGTVPPDVPSPAGPDHLHHVILGPHSHISIPSKISAAPAAVRLHHDDADRHRRAASPVVHVHKSNHAIAPVIQADTATPTNPHRQRRNQQQLQLINLHRQSSPPPTRESCPIDAAAAAPLPAGTVGRTDSLPAGTVGRTDRLPAGTVPKNRANKPCGAGVQPKPLRAPPQANRGAMTATSSATLTIFSSKPRSFTTTTSTENQPFNDNVKTSRSNPESTPNPIPSHNRRRRSDHVHHRSSNRISAAMQRQANCEQRKLQEELPEDGRRKERKMQSWGTDGRAGTGKEMWETETKGATGKRSGGAGGYRYGYLCRYQRRKQLQAAQQHGCPYHGRGLRNLPAGVPT